MELNFKKIQQLDAHEILEILLPSFDNIYKSVDYIGITKDDYIKILELLRTPSFTKMMSVYSPKESMIASLKLGYIDGKCFSTSAISEFLGIETQEVIDTTRKVLLAYKERINEIIDGTIQFVSEEPEITTSSLSKSFHK